MREINAHRDAPLKSVVHRPSGSMPQARAAVQSHTSDRYVARRIPSGWSRSQRSGMTTKHSESSSFPAPRPSPALMAALTVVNRWCMLRWRFRIRAIDLPPLDRERLARVTSPDTAAFLAPNHPEFGLDWMIDKEISARFAPRMAAWAAHEIIAAAPWFWLRNNLVSNRGGPAAFDYSVEWALRGHGVLLHPEGSVHWTSSYVHPLFAGIADMALEAARRAAAYGDARPVLIVPIVWRLRYTRDVSAGIHADMRLIERALGLSNGDGSSVAGRFAMLQANLLAARMSHFQFDRASVASLDFFARQAAFRAWLVDDLVSRHRVERGESIEHTIHRVAKLPLDPHDRARVAEAERLGGFTATVYDAPTLGQEEIAESLKRLRASLLRNGLRHSIHNALPTPYGPRAVHVRVPEPIRIDAARALADIDEQSGYRDELLARTRNAMQQRLDELGQELAPTTDRFRHENPLYRGPTATRPFSSAPPESVRSAGV